MRKRDEQAVELASQMEEASYLVVQTVHNREWLLHHGQDYKAILAAREAEHAASRQRYMDYKASVA